MLTALNSLIDKIKGYDTEVDDAIIKPLKFRQHFMKIRGLLKRTFESNIPAGTILKVADLEVDLDCKDVKR
jgi:two-component system, OmpR family, copper resistance phosphate regulon response regulator CusR